MPIPRSARWRRCRAPGGRSIRDLGSPRRSAIHPEVKVGSMAPIPLSQLVYILTPFTRPDIDLDADDYVLNRALLYRDRRDLSRTSPEPPCCWPPMSPERKQNR